MKFLSHRTELVIISNFHVHRRSKKIKLIAIKFPSLVARVLHISGKVQLHGKYEVMTWAAATVVAGNCKSISHFAFSDEWNLNFPFFALFSQQADVSFSFLFGGNARKMGRSTIQARSRAFFSIKSMFAAASYFETFCCITCSIKVVDILNCMPDVPCNRSLPPQHPEYY